MSAFVQCKFEYPRHPLPLNNFRVFVQPSSSLAHTQPQPNLAKAGCQFRARDGSSGLVRHAFGISDHCEIDT